MAERESPKEDAEEIEESDDLTLRGVGGGDPGRVNFREEYGRPGAPVAIEGTGEIRAPMPSIAGDVTITTTPNAETETRHLFRGDTRISAAPNAEMQAGSASGPSPFADVVVSGPPATASADVPTDAAISINSEPIVFEIKIPEARVTQGEADPDGVLTATAAALARHDPRTLIRQTEDVRRRMFQLSDAHPESTVREAARAAHASLTIVLDYLNGDVPEPKARPHFRSLAVLTAELLELGVVFTEQPEVAALFKAVRLITQYCMRLEK